MVLIGLNDMLADWGLPGQYDHPRVRETYAKTIAACRTTRSIAASAGFLPARSVAEFVPHGARYVVDRHRPRLSGRRLCPEGEACARDSQEHISMLGTSIRDSWASLPLVGEGWSGVFGARQGPTPNPPHTGEGNSHRDHARVCIGRDGMRSDVRTASDRRGSRLCRCDAADAFRRRVLAAHGVRMRTRWWSPAVSSAPTCAASNPWALPPADLSRTVAAGLINPRPALALRRVTAGRRVARWRRTASAFVVGTRAMAEAISMAMIRHRHRGGAALDAFRHGGVLTYCRRSMPA